MKLDDPVLMAQVGGAHGIKGEVRVRPFGDDPLTLGDYGKLHTKDGHALKITRMRVAKNGLVVKFKGINFRDEAQALNGIELYVDRSMLPNDMDEDEFYVADLIGCVALDPDGDVIGQVHAVPNFGAGDLVELRAPGASQTMLVEFTRANVPHIDLDKRKITIILPQEVSERDS